MTSFVVPENVPELAITDTMRRVSFSRILSMSSDDIPSVSIVGAVVPRACCPLAFAPDRPRRGTGLVNV